jgi:16S rRNA C1402 (ribose-2'-O) methylase RsmI
VLAARPSIKGEFAVVIAAAPADTQAADEPTIEAEISNSLKTMSASQAAKHVGKLLKLPRDEIYQRILDRKEHKEQVDE